MSRILVIGPYTKSMLSFRGEMMKEFIHLGHKVIAMAPEQGYENDFVQLGIDFRLLPMKRTGLNPIEDVLLLCFLIRTLKHYQPDILFVYTIKPVTYGSIAAKIVGIKRVYSMITGLGYVFSGNSIKQRMIRSIAVPLYKISLKNNIKVFFQNPDDMNTFIAKSMIKHEQTVLVDGSGVDTEKFSFSVLPAGPVIFLLIARLLWDKGIAEYVKAAGILKQKYPAARFQILGPFDPNPRSISRDEVEKWAGRGIEYLGETHDVRPYIESASVFVLPSYREGTPRSVLEAMAMGRPIITSDAPGCRETVLHGYNGLLVPVRDAQALAESMEFFIKNPEKIEDMGKKSREQAMEKFDVRKVNRTILQAMELDK